MPGFVENVNRVAQGLTPTFATNVETVAENILDVNAVAAGIADVAIVADNIDAVVAVGPLASGLTTVVTNITEILAADDNAATATTQAGIATTQATAAATSASTATTKATEASNSASSAAGSAASALVSAVDAEDAATAAGGSATAASLSAASATASALSASTSASNAAMSEDNAGLSEIAAAASATSAGNSATAAAASATTATTKASEATASAASASTSASNAVSSATNAANSASEANTSATAAANSATLADASANAAASSALSASTSESNAAISESNAALSETASAGSAAIASTKAYEATTAATSATSSEAAAEASAIAAASSANIASTSAATATTQAGIATTAATEASASASSAASALASVQTIFDNFDDIYLGAKASDPTVDNDGNALAVGALYYNTTTSSLKIWTGSAWNPAAFDVGGAVVSSFNTRTGDVTLTSGDVTAALGFTPEPADAAIVKEATVDTLTNKTLDDVSNLVGADHVHYRVRNSTGSTINIGTVVKASATQPGTDYILIEPVTDPQTQVAIGIVHQTLANNAIGLVINTGVQTDFDTSAWTVGTILYPNTAGGLTSTKPTSGRYQACAYVLRQHSSSGTLLCEFTEPKLIASTTQAGYVQLNNTLTSTSTTEALTAAQGKVLQDGKQPLDATLTALAGVTTAADKIIYATASDTFTTTTLSSFGRSLIDDADAAAALTTLGAASSSHVHGDISNTGTISTAAVTPANTDYLLLADASNSNKIQRGVAIGTSTTTYLRNDGTWATPTSVANLDDLTDVTITTPSSGQVLSFNGSAWVNSAAISGVTDHGLLSGLLDDDHTQYYNQTRGDARYAQVSHVHGDITNDGAITSTAVTPTNTDYLLISDTSNSGKIQRGVAIGSGTTTFLRNDGTWGTPTGTTYSLATASVLGLIKLGSDTVQSTAPNAVTTTASRSYAIQANASGQLVVNVPWTDTVYSLPASVVHDTEPSALHPTDALRISGTTLSLYKGDGSFESVTTQDTIYTHPSTDGNLHVPATGTTNNGKVLTAGATAGAFSWQTPASVITDHTLLSNIGTNTHAQIDTALTRLANTSGTNTGDQDLSGYSTISHSHDDATTLQAGFLSANDKVKLDAQSYYKKTYSIPVTANNTTSYFRVGSFDTSKLANAVIKVSGTVNGYTRTFLYRHESSKSSQNLTNIAFTISGTYTSSIIFAGLRMLVDGTGASDTGYMELGVYQGGTDYTMDVVLEIFDAVGFSVDSSYSAGSIPANYVATAGTALFMASRTVGAGYIVVTGNKQIRQIKKGTGMSAEGTQTITMPQASWDGQNFNELVINVRTQGADGNADGIFHLVSATSTSVTVYYQKFGTGTTLAYPIVEVTEEKQ